MGRAREALAMTSITATTGTQGYPLPSASNARTGATQAASSGALPEQHQRPHADQDQVVEREARRA